MDMEQTQEEEQEHLGDKRMTNLEQTIRKYAFTHDCDMDEAAYRVLVDILHDVSIGRSREGLYDRLFSTESPAK